MSVLREKRLHKIAYIQLNLTLLIGMIMSSFLGATTVNAVNAPQVSTGVSTACVVVSNQVKCWGNNDQGQLGIASTGGSKTTPTAIYNKNTSTPAQYVCVPYWWWCVNVLVAPEIPASAMAGKKATKVSVGAKHVCAIANATVYCWGDNSRGQLGRAGGSSSVPVVADLSTSSALRGKEVIDISASDNFTCALASDGSVACWGDNQYGQLGNGSFTSSSTPVKVVNDGEMAGQIGVQLAKASGYNMCVTAHDARDTTSSTSGTPYCWGKGMGRGTIADDTRSVFSTCSAVVNSTAAPVYFNANKPVKIGGGVTIALADGSTYMTANGTNKVPYYWGMHGYVETITYRVGVVASMGSTQKSHSINLATKLGGSYPDIRLVSLKANPNTSAANSASRTANQYNTRGATNRSSSFNSKTGQAAPGYHPSTSALGGGNSGNANNRSSANNKPNAPPCTATTYTVFHNYDEIGTLTATEHRSTSLTNSNINTLSGNVVDGLFCAVKTNGVTYCDANGTSMNEGQTGSAYTQQCTSYWYYVWYTTCMPAPTGPQAVTSTGWLNGRSVVRLNTSVGGYTCAVANDNSVGCWGLNNAGQLGVGDTSNRNVPTRVNL